MTITGQEITNKKMATIDDIQSFFVEKGEACRQTAIGPAFYQSVLCGGVEWSDAISH